MHQQVPNAASRLSVPWDLGKTRNGGLQTYTTTKTATKIEMNPTNVSQLSLSNLRMLAMAAMTIVPMKENHTVQMACMERAFSPMETPRIPEPAARM